MSTEHAPASAPADDDLWLVKLPDGTVRSMTIDAMDEAFQSGELSATTAVQAPDGDGGFTTLGALAGLDESGEALPEPAAPAVAAPTDDVAAPAVAAAAERDSRDSIEPPSATTPSLAPMVASIAPPSSAVALSERPSVAPALDVDLDSAEAQIRAGKKKTMLGFAAVAVGLVLAGAAVSYVSGGERPEAPKAAAQPVQEVVAPPPVDPAFEAKPQLTEEQKKRLADADKARNAKKGTAGPAQGNGAAPTPHHKEGNPFQNGGDKYDPLNGSL